MTAICPGVLMPPAQIPGFNRRPWPRFAPSSQRSPRRSCRRYSARFPPTRARSAGTSDAGSLRHRDRAAPLHRRRSRGVTRRLPKPRVRRAPRWTQPRWAAVSLSRRRPGRMAAHESGRGRRRCERGGAADTRRGDVRVHRPTRRRVDRGLYGTVKKIRSNDNFN